MLKKWAKEMCFVIVASHWMIRVHGLGDLKIAFYQNCPAIKRGTKNLVASVDDFMRFNGR